MEQENCNNHKTRILRTDHGLESPPARPPPRECTPVPDKKAHHRTAANSEVVKDKSASHDFNSGMLLGRYFDDNLATIASGDPVLLDIVDSLPGAILTEEKLMRLTNSIGSFLASETWMNEPLDVKRYLSIRNEWFYLAKDYKNQRSDVLYIIESNLSSFLSDPTTDAETKRLLLELYESKQYNNFINSLRQVDARLAMLDESVSRVQQDQVESLGSIFDPDDYTLIMDDKNTRKARSAGGEDYGAVSEKRGPTREHWTLRGLVDHNQFRPADLTVNMMTRTSQQPQTLAEDGHESGRVLNKELETMLCCSLIELIKEIEILSLDIKGSADEMIGVKPSNHTNNLVKSYEKKMEKIVETKEKLNSTFCRYIEEYDRSTGMNEIGGHVWSLSSELSRLRENLQSFRDMAKTRVDFEETSYEQQRDSRAPELRIDVFKPENSIVSCLKWLRKNCELPRNLLDGIIKKAFPVSVLERLNLQHPENSRSSEDVIVFLLKSYGRTGQVEEQLRKYHEEVGSINAFFSAGHKESINLDRCNEVVINADLHLAGLRYVLQLRDLCNDYLGSGETLMLFEENLLTHSYTTWIAKCILTCTQINKLSQMKLKSGERKLKWIITELEDLRDVAERLIHSGMAGLQQDVPTATSVLMTNQTNSATTQDYVGLWNDSLLDPPNHDEWSPNHSQGLPCPPK